MHRGDEACTFEILFRQVVTKVRDHSAARAN